MSDAGNVDADAPSKAIRRSIGQLNQGGTLAEKISYSEVASDLAAVEEEVALQILENLKVKAGAIEEPTKYVQDQVARVQAGETLVKESSNGEPAKRSSSDAADPVKKIARQVGRLNNTNCLSSMLSYKDVIDPLLMLDTNDALKILRDLERAAGKSHVEDPTNYVLSAAKRAGASIVPKATARRAGGGGGSKKIAQQIGWLNKNAGLAQNLSYNDISEPLSYIEMSAAMKILKDLEERAESVKDPTNYVLAAVNRASSSDGYGPDPDTTRKIGRQVGWLNKNADLKDQISYSDVVEPLSWLDASEAMKILKNVEEKASDITNPTSYIQKAAANAWQEPVAIDSTGKIAKQIGWLNRNASLQDQISYKDAVEPLSRLDITEAMKILKGIEERASEINNPTGYILKAVGNAVQRGPSEYEWKADPSGKIGKQVGWLNKNADLVKPIIFSEVVGPLSSLDLTEAMKILKDLQGSAENVRDPTNYVITAAVNAGAFFDTVGPPPGLHDDSWWDDSWTDVGPMTSKEISMRIGKLNRRGILQEQLSYNDVKESLESIGGEAASSILRDLANRADSVRNPTAYVLRAAENAVSGGNGNAKRARVTGA